MALKMPKLFGEPKPKLAAAEAELDMPTTQVKMGAAAPSGYDPLASVSVMEQLRAATAKSVAPWKLPVVGDMPVAKQLSVTDGFPRRTLKERDLTDGDVVIVRGLLELDELLRAVRRLVDTLQQHPEALLQGKPEPRKEKD